ncbi:MAG TPA: Coq4 family protein [Rhizomicrobium sp.]|nr:Coq4 family protein [Rhizomicrobium sp.]
MTTQTSVLKPAVDARSIGTKPIKVLKALKAFRQLAQNKEDTEQVFEIIRALSGSSILRNYHRMLKSAEGGRQAYVGEELADKLVDREWLAQFAPGTVGARYKEFIAPRNLSASGLAEESRKLGEPDVDAAHPVAWFMRRLRDVHDVWHVLTGYGTDALGEASVVAFTYGQLGNFSLAFLSAGAAVELHKAHWPQPYARAIYEGYARGKKAEWLPALDYHKLFETPLEEARAQLKLERPRIYESVPPEARNGYRYGPEAAVPGGWLEAT